MKDFKLQEMSNLTTLNKENLFSFFSNKDILQAKVLTNSSAMNLYRKTMLILPTFSFRLPSGFVSSAGLVLAVLGGFALLKYLN